MFLEVLQPCKTTQIAVIICTICFNLCILLSQRNYVFRNKQYLFL
jgi:hypothetical protein